MSNPYTNFNNVEGVHYPRTASGEQPYAVAAAVALKRLGATGLGSIINTANTWATGFPAGAVFGDVGFVPTVERITATSEQPGAFTTNFTGVTTINRFQQASSDNYWAGGTALPYHYAQMAAAYRRDQTEIAYGNTLAGLQQNLSTLTSDNTAAAYVALSDDFNSFLNDPAANRDVIRASSLMAAIQVDDPTALPAPEIDGQNGLTSEASNPGSDSWRAPGYSFNYVIDTTNLDQGSDANPFVAAAQEFNTRITPGDANFINLPEVNGPGTTPTIAVLLPARNLTAPVTVTTPAGQTNSGQVARFDLQGRRANIHFIGPWSNDATTNLAQAQTDARDDQNSTYRATLSPNANGAAGSAQLGFRVANQSAELDIHLWCVSVESACETAVLCAADTPVGNQSALGDVQVKLNLCKITDKKPTATLPECLYGIKASNCRLDLDGVYVDLPYTQRDAVRLENALKGDMLLRNLQVERAGGAALLAVRTSAAVDTIEPITGPGTLTLEDWNSPSSWTSRLASEAKATITIAGIHQNVRIEDCLVNESVAAPGRAATDWGSVPDHLAANLGTTLAYTPASFDLVNELNGFTLGDTTGSGQFTNKLDILSSDFFTKAPYAEVVRVDSADEVNITLSDIFAGDTTNIEGPGGELTASPAIYLAPNNLGNLPQAPAAGLLRGVTIENLNDIPPANSVDPELFGGGDPNAAIAPTRINTGFDLSASDGVSFSVFTGGQWSPETGNPALGDFTALFYVYNTAYQNKDLRYIPLLESRIDVATRADLLDGNVSGSQGEFVTQMRTQGTSDDREIDDFVNPWGMIQRNFGSGPIFLKDGTFEPYYELSHPVIYQFIRNNGTKYYYVFDPLIPESADWDEASKTGKGPAYVRLIREQSYQKVGGAYEKRPRWAVDAGKTANLPLGSDSTDQGYRWEVTNLVPGRVTNNQDPYADRFKGVTETFVGRHREGSSSGSPVWPAPSIDWDITVVTDPDSGKLRCDVHLKRVNESHWWTNGTSWSFGQKKSGEFFRRVNGVPSLLTGYDRDPGLFSMENVRHSHDTVNTFGQNSGAPHWINRGKSDTLRVIDSDLSDNRKEHLIYYNTQGDIEFRRSTFRRAGSQSVQLVNRSWHYGPYSKIEDMTFGPLLQGVTRPTRDTTTNFPGTPPPSLTLNDVRIPSWNPDYPFEGNQYEPDNSPTTARATAFFDDCHFIDSARAGTRPAFALTFFGQGAGRYPLKIDIRNCSWVSAYVERVKPNANAVDMLDVTQVAAHGTDTSTPFYHQTNYRSGGSFVTTTTATSQYGKTQEVQRHVKTVDLSAQTSDAQKEAWLTSNLTEAPYQIAPGRYDRLAEINNADYQWPGPGRDNWTTPWSGAGSAEYENWRSFMRNMYASASYAQGTEGYQQRVPFNGANEWLVKDSSTGNMWWYNNDVREYEPDGVGGYKFIDRWINLGPITGNPRTEVSFTNCLWDNMNNEKPDFIIIRATDHVTFDGCAFVNRRDDNPAKSAALSSMNRGQSIAIDEQSPGTGDGFNDNRGCRTRRVTLSNIFARPHNITTDLGMDWFDDPAYLAATEGTPQEIVSANGTRRWDNIIGPISLRLGKIVARSADYSPAGEGIGGYRAAGINESTAINTTDFGLTLSGLDLRDETVEFVLVPGTSNQVGGGPDGQFMTDWAAAGYPLPEIATDVTFPDGSNHEYLKYPPVFETYINASDADGIPDFPLRTWSWVALWNGTAYTDGGALKAALPKVAGWIDPDTFAF